MNKTLRVLHIADFAAPYRGNFLPSIDKLKTELENSKGQLMLALPQRAQQREWFEGFKKEFGDQLILIPPGNKLFQLKFFFKIIKSHNINIVHTHFIYYDIPAFIAAFFARAKVFWHSHSEWGSSHPVLRALKDFVKHRLLGLNAYHIAVSDSIQNGLLKRLAYKSRTFAVCNGIDLDRIPNDLPDKESAKKAFGLDPARFTFMIFAWAPERKGLDIALDALRKLSKMEPKQFLLVVVGREQTQHFLESHLSDNYLNNVVKLIAPIQNVFELFAATDCFCSFARYEGFSYALYESMAFGNMVLANDIPPLKPLHESDAIFFKHNDSSNAAEKMKIIMHMSDAERLKISQSNSKFVREKYNVAIWAKQIVEAYRKVI